MMHIILWLCVGSRHMLLLGGLILPLCFGQAVKAGEKPAIVKIVGLGATSCLQFTTDVEKSPAVQRDYLAWAQGFMSGVLLSRPAGVDEGLNLAPPTFPLLRQLEFLRGYCQQRPNEDFSDAVLDLYKRLRKEPST